MLKKFKNSTRYVGILLAVLLVGGLVASAFGSIFTLISNREDYVIKVGENKIYPSMIKSLNDELSKTLFIASLIDKEVMDKYKNKLHLSISSNEIDEKYSEKISRARSRVNRRISERDLVRIVYGTTIAKLRSSIYNEIMNEKIREIIVNSYSPKERDIKKVMSDEDCDRDRAIYKLKSDNGNKYFKNWLQEERTAVNLEIKDPDFAKYAPFNLLSLGSLKVTNHEFANTMSIYVSYPMILNYMPGDSSEEKAAKFVYKSLNRDMLLAGEALSKGVRCSRDLSNLDKINYLKGRMEEKIKDEINVRDRDLKAYFFSNRDKYDEKERAYVDIVFLPFKPSNTDIEERDREANDILNSAIKSNSLPKGMEQKKMSKEEFTKKFGRKFFRKNEVVPSLFLNEGKKIVAKDEGESVSFVELEAKMSKETKESLERQASKILDQIEKEHIDMKKAVELYSDVNFKKKITVHRDGKLDKELEKAIMSSDRIEKVVTGKGIYIFKRSSYYPEKRAVFEDVRNRVVNDYKSSVFDKKVEEAISDISSRKSVKIEKSFFKDLIEKK